MLSPWFLKVSMRKILKTKKTKTTIPIEQINTRKIRLPYQIHPPTTFLRMGNKNILLSWGKSHQTKNMFLILLFSKFTRGFSLLSNYNLYTYVYKTVWLCGWWRREETKYPTHKAYARLSKVDIEIFQQAGKLHCRQRRKDSSLKT